LPETIAGCLHLVAAEAGEVAADQGMVIVEKMAPALIAKLGCFSVDPTISVKSTVARTRSVTSAPRDPVRNSSIVSEISSAFSPT
jgi:hypothetical protein